MDARPTAGLETSATLLSLQNHAVTVLVRRRRCRLRLEASGPLALLAQNLFALCVYESFGSLRFLLGL
jgi:hypothetical protein